MVSIFFYKIFRSDTDSRCIIIITTSTAKPIESLVLKQTPVFN